MQKYARLFVLLWTMLAPLAASAGELRVYFFDVGQGDAALIISPAGKTVLIDAGPPESSSRLRARLDSLLNGPLDLAILTHAHLDHLGGMEDALAAHGAKLFMDSGFEHPSPSYQALLEYVRAHHIPMVNAKPGRTFDLGGGAALKLLGPPQPFLSGTPSDANANSVVAMLTFGKRAFLFAADAEGETESWLLKSGAPLRADVLKVSHHGARTSSTLPFVQAVKPSYAVISCGAGNAFGLPARASTDRLESVGARVLRTDLDGEVRIVSDGKNVSVKLGGEPMVAPTALADVPAPPEHASKSHHGKKEASAARAPEVKPAGKVLAVGHGSGKYVASQKSEVFHFADCPWAKRIKPENVITFDTREQAIASGRHPAGCCNP